MLREDRHAVDDDVEDTAASTDQLRVEPERFADFGRQTGGPRKVVSNSAVMDLNLHRFGN